MNIKLARGIAWFLVGIYFILTGIGLFPQVWTNTTPGDLDFPIILYLILVVVVGIWPVLGALIIAHHPRHPVGWLLFAAFPVVAIDMFSLGYISYATSIVPGTLPIPGAMLIWLNWSGLPFVAVTITLMNLLFPTGRLPSSRWRAVVWTSIGALLVYLCLQTIEPGPLSLFPALDNPYAVAQSVWAVLAPLYFTTIAIMSLCGMASVGSLMLRLHRVQGDERQQIKWLFAPALLFCIATPFSFLTDYDANGLISMIGVGLHLISVPATVIAVSFAIFRYRLYDIDIIIKRTLVYGTLTATIIAIYVLVVGGLGVLLQAEGRLLISLVATGVVAVLFQPLRERLQRGVNRFFFGQRDDPLGALSQLGRQLETAITTEVVLPTLVETIAQTLKLPYVAISLRSGDEFTMAAQIGAEVADALRLPLIYQGETMGQLMAGPRGPGELFSQTDRQLLENIAYQAGITAYAVQLARDLRHSRVRLVTAREEERRRLRRDLHDGLGPVLASQGLKMAAASQLLQENPTQAQLLLGELMDQNAATMTEIRRLVYELRPAALDDLGLVGAVRDYASGLKGGSRDAPRVRIDVHAPAGALPSLPAAIEVAVYRIATEALTNVARHAQARHASVSLALAATNQGHNLHVEIVDDGIGLPQNHRCGIGLISMRERAEEVGGTFRIQSAPKKGACILAVLPLPKVE